MSVKRENPIPESKKKTVAEFIDLIKNKKTILLASIKNLPASQFQEIGKKLRNKAIVKVPKKNLVFRALDSSEGEAIKKLKELIKNDVAILFSDLDAFELAGELLENKSPAKAKPGQEAPEDITIEAGPTSLVPGPAISELGAVGIQIQIKEGKIEIKAPKVIVKKGEKISKEAADIMGKLDIKPFSIGFIPLCAFDNTEKKLYLDIKIDKKETLEKLKTAHGKALPFAVKIGYPTKDTIKFLIGKAGSHGKALEKLKPEITESLDSEDKKEINKEGEGEGEIKKEVKEEVKPEEAKSEEPKPKENIQTPEENKSKGEEK